MIGRCENYEGTVYDDPDQDEIPFVYPEDSVALNTVVYVKGTGMNCRVVNLPGSDVQRWAEETGAMGLCDCSPPAVWSFIAIDGTDVVEFNTLNTHEAVHLMQHPDHLFDADYKSDGASLKGNLRMVPPIEGMLGVVGEMCDYLADRGVPGMREDGAMTYDEASGFDVDDFITNIFGENK